MGIDSAVGLHWFILDWFLDSILFKAIQLLLGLDVEIENPPLQQQYYGAS